MASITKCNECHKRVFVANGKKIDPQSGEVHRCREDAYDVPGHKRLPLWIPKTDRFKK